MSPKECLALLEENWYRLAKSKDPALEPAMRFLANHMENPRSYVTLVGETSSGKSTLINAFLGERFLLAGARPTTGTVTWVEHGLADTRRLLAVNRNATVEELSDRQFAQLSEKPDRDLLRLKAEMPAVRAGFKGLNVFDTPGFNAIISEHAEVLREFLPESDVVVFPVSYKVGFGSSDRSLMGLVCDVREQFGEEFPVILVVNRAPAGTTESDKRVREIRGSAEDALHGKVDLVIVEAALPTPEGESVLPNADALWKKVGATAFADARTRMLEGRFRQMLGNLFNQRVRELEGELDSAALGEKAIDELRVLEAEYRADEQKAHVVVDRYMDRIRRDLPKLFAQERQKLLEVAEREIDEADKWVDGQSCGSFVYSHVLPFGTTEIQRAVEHYLQEVLSQLDDELSEMANRAVRRLNDRIPGYGNPNLVKLMGNLCGRVGERAMGKVVSNTLAKFGGRGGTAVGLGNLVKKGVSKAGNLVGKKFSKEVYKQIGKFFTKRTLQIMSACLDVVVEIGFFVLEAHRWKGQLKEKVAKTLEDWNAKVDAEIGKSMIPECAAANHESVKACYAGMIQEVEASLENASRNYSEEDVRALEADRDALSRAIRKLEK